METTKALVTPGCLHEERMTAKPDGLEPAKESASSDSPYSLPYFMRRLIVWGVVIAAGCIGLSYLAFLIYWTWQGREQVKDIVQQHFAAIIGLPLAAVGAFVLVTVLQITALDVFCHQVATA